MILFCHEAAMVGASSRTTTFYPAMWLNTRALGLQSCQRRRDRECSATREPLHPAAQLIPALVNLKMHPTGLTLDQARCLRWVKSAVLSLCQPLLVYPHQRTSSGRCGWSGWRKKKDRENCKCNIAKRHSTFCLTNDDGK